MFFMALKIPCLKETSILMRILNNNRLCLLPSFRVNRCAILRYRADQCCPNPCGKSGQSGQSGSGKTSHRVTYMPYVRPPSRSHDDKNMSLNRPMSPHLTIYAPTLPAMTSIVQRITGIIVTFYALLLSSGSLFLSNGVETYVSVIQSLDMSRPLIFLVKILLGAPFVYHYFNGIRFVMWNAGKWLSIKDVYDTARKSFVATAIVTLIFTLI